MPSEADRVRELADALMKPSRSTIIPLTDETGFILYREERDLVVAALRATASDRVREPTVEEIARAIHDVDGGFPWDEEGEHEREWYRDLARPVQDLYAPALRAASTAADEARRGAWRPIETAPKEEAVLIATTGEWVGEAMLVATLDDGFAWTWANGERVHANHVVLGWQPLPEPPCALATTAETGQDGTGGGA